MKLENENCKWKIQSRKLKIEIVCGNTVQLWPPTVASHCGRPWEYRSKLLLTNFPMFSYRRPWEATVGGHGNTTQNCF